MGAALLDRKAKRGLPPWLFVGAWGDRRKARAFARKVT